MPIRATSLMICIAGLAACAEQPVPSAQLALHPEGLRQMPGTPQDTVLRFGSDRTATIEAVSAALGAPVEQGEIAECNAVYINWAPDFTAYFDEFGFSGWAVRTGQTPYENGIFTRLGIGIGSTRTDLEDAYDVVIEPSTLGLEFSANGFSGLLENEGAEARVTYLWSGNACIFR